MQESTVTDQSSQNGDPNLYAEIRTELSEENIKKAEELLETVPNEIRGAEWHFLKGCTLTHNGWFHDAQLHFDTAHKLDPDNTEYEEAASSLNNSANDYSSVWQNGSKVTQKDKKLCSEKNECFCEGCLELGCECICEGLFEACDGI